MDAPGNLPGSVARLQELLATEDFPEREPTQRLREFAEEAGLALDELSRARDIRKRCSAMLHSSDARLP